MSRQRKLKPIVDWIGKTPIYHGERGGELDLHNPDACLCGERDYLMCNGPGLESMTIGLGPDGLIEVTP